MSDVTKDPRYPAMCESAKKRWMDKGKGEKEAQMLSESEVVYQLELEGIFFKTCEDCGCSIPHMSRCHQNNWDTTKFICGQCYDKRYR